MKHLLIILISFLLLSPFLTSCEKYVGEYKDGKRNGQGTLTTPGGAKYVGEWKDGKQNGQGTYTYPDGSTYVGEWKEHYEWEGTEYDKDGTVIATYSEGVETEI